MITCKQNIEKKNKIILLYMDMESFIVCINAEDIYSCTAEDDEIKNKKKQKSNWFNKR